VLADAEGLGREEDGAAGLGEQAVLREDRLDGVERGGEEDGGEILELEVVGIGRDGDIEAGQVVGGAEDPVAARADDHTVEDALHDLADAIDEEVVDRLAVGGIAGEAQAAGDEGPERGAHPADLEPVDAAAAGLEEDVLAASDDLPRTAGDDLDAVVRVGDTLDIDGVAGVGAGEVHAARGGKLDVEVAVVVVAVGDIAVIGDNPGLPAAEGADIGG